MEKAIRYLIFIVTTRCNLQCSYCYNGEAPGYDMTEDVIDRALEVVSESKGPLHIQITGGEPTLVPHIVEEILQKVRATIKRPYSVGLQTNGTALSADFIKKLKKFGVQIGISLDGPPAIHEELRGKAGLTFKTMAMLEHFQVPFRITTVVTARNAGFLDKLLYTVAGFNEMKGIGLDIVIKKGRALSKSSEIFPSSDGLKKGIESLLAAYETVNKIRSTPIVIRELERIQNLLNKKNGSKFFCHASRGESMAVMPDGTVFPCGQTAGDVRFFAGDVWNIDESKLNLLSRFKLPETSCSGCVIEHFCPGDCPSRIFYNGKDANLACVMYQTIWHALKDRTESL